MSEQSATQCKKIQTNNSYLKHKLQYIYKYSIIEIFELLCALVKCSGFGALILQCREWSPVCRIFICNIFCPFVSAFLFVVSKHSCIIQNIPRIFSLLFCVSQEQKRNTWFKALQFNYPQPSIDNRASTVCDTGLAATSYTIHLVSRKIIHSYLCAHGVKELSTFEKNET